MSPSRQIDLAVVGAGVVGLSAALAAHDHGLEVRCFEAARPGAGQSAGTTRIFRHRHDRPELVELAVRARRAWERWEGRFGRRLLGDEGVLMTPPGLDEHAGRFDAAGVEYRTLDPDDQRRALPVAAPLADAALLDVRGGAIRAREAVSALAAALGERLVLAEVMGLHPARGGVEVHTAEGICRAGLALVCAGFDTAGLAGSLGLRLPVESGLHLRATFPVRGGLPGDRLACLLDRREGLATGGAYASSCDGGRRYAVGLHASEVELDEGPALAGEASLAPAAEDTSRYVAEWLPGLDPEPVELRLCRTTSLPSDQDAFAAWQRGPVTVLAGHNLFKFAPVLGPLLVDAARSGDLPPELALAPEAEAAAGGAHG